MSTTNLSSICVKYLLYYCEEEFGETRNRVDWLRIFMANDEDIDMKPDNEEQTMLSISKYICETVFILCTSMKPQENPNLPKVQKYEMSYEMRKCLTIAYCDFHSIKLNIEASISRQKA